MRNSPPSTALPPPPVPGRDASLFLDFDGTLVDLAPHPDAVEVSAALRDTLDRVAAALPGRVAIVSGRSLAQIDAILGDFAARVAVAGSHGAERRDAGASSTSDARPEGLDHAAAALRDFAADHALVFEDKSLGAALHYRARPDHEDDAVATAAIVAEQYGLALQRGKMMVEVRAPGTKGDAVAAMMDTPAMAGTRPFFLGDDVTDEDGFEAATRAGGAGVLVGATRDTAAAYRLDDPAAVIAWLDAVAAANGLHEAEAA